MAGKRKGFGFSIGLDITDFERSCKNLNKQIDQLLGANIVKMSNMAAGALAGVTTAISAIGAAAYNFGSQMDAMKTALEGTWGSAQKATQQYEKFQKIVENTSFNMSTLMAADKTMKSLGLSMDDSAKAVKRLADVAIANPNTSIEALSGALQQIKITGTASSRALKVFADAGIDVADVAGKDAATAITMLMDRMQKFNGYIENEATDIWQQIPRIVAIVKDMLAELGNYLNDNFKEYFVAAGNVVSNLRDRFKDLLSDKDGLARFYEELKRIMTTMAAFASVTAVKFAVSLAPIAAQLVAVVAGVEVLYDLLGEVSIWDKFVNGCKYAVAKVKEYFYSYIEKPIANIYKKLADTFGTAQNVQTANSWLDDIDKSLGQAQADASNASNKMGNGVLGSGTESLTMKAINGITSLFDSYNTELSKLKTPNGNTSNIIGGSQTITHKFDFGGGSRSSGTTTSGNNNPIGASLMEQLYSVGESINSYAQVMGENCSEWFNKGIEDYNKKIAKDNAWKDYKTNMVATLADGFTEVLFASGNFFQNMGEMLKNLGKQILQQIAQFMILKTLFSAFGIKGVDMTQFSPIAGFMSDGVVQNGKIIGTDPNDTIIAMKHPENLGNNGANVVVNVNNNSQSQISTNSWFDGTREIIDIFIDGFTHNVNGVRDMVRSS